MHETFFKTSEKKVSYMDAIYARYATDFMFSFEVKTYTRDYANLLRY